MTLKIATRKSKLAQVQTELVMGLIEDKYNIKCEKVLTDTLGDQRLDVTLDKIGGKGVFIKELERLMALNLADAAVHSAKDMPFELPEGFILAATPVREDVRDAFVSRDNTHFKDLPKGARIGTSSKRRMSQLLLLRPDLEIVPVRGNVQTRISKMESENLHGIILASAGLKRLGMEHIITDYFEVNEIVPAIGQGALGIEIKSDSKDAEIFKGLNNEDVMICVNAERSFMKALKGDCHSTIGAYATLNEEIINMVGIYEIEGKLYKSSIIGSKCHSEELGRELAYNLLKLGGQY